MSEELHDTSLDSLVDVEASYVCPCCRTRQDISLLCIPKSKKTYGQYTQLVKAWWCTKCGIPNKLTYTLYESKKEKLIFNLQEFLLDNQKIEYRLRFKLEREKEIDSSEESRDE